MCAQTDAGKHAPSHTLSCAQQRQESTVIRLQRPAPTTRKDIHQKALAAWRKSFNLWQRPDCLKTPGHFLLTSRQSLLLVDLLLLNPLEVKALMPIEALLFNSFCFPGRFCTQTELHSETESDREQIVMLMPSFFCVQYSVIISYSAPVLACLFAVSLAVPLIGSINNGCSYHNVSHWLV